MPPRPSPSVAIGALGVVVAAATFIAFQWRAATGTTAAGFWFEQRAYDLPRDVTLRLGSPLSREEHESIERVSRRVVARAFDGLRIVITTDPDAFWSVRVVQALDKRRRLLPSAGESYGFGFLGGGGVVSFPNLALNAVKHALPSVTRAEIIDGIARGIGNAAAHELAHQILGFDLKDDRDDEGSYEYLTSDRRAQYFGELRWTTAWPLLRRKFGE